MSPVFVLLASLTLCIGAVVQQQYIVSNVSMGSDGKLQIAMFTVKFEEDIYLGNQLLSSLSNLPMTGAGDMPYSMIAQMGSASLTCPCSGGVCSPDSNSTYCNAATCTYPSNMQQMINGPPDFALPLPSVREPMFLIFSALSNDIKGLQSAEPVNKTFGIAKILSMTDLSGTIFRMVPSNLELDKCTIQFSNMLTLQQQNNSLNGVTVSNFTQSNAVCNFTALLGEIDALIQFIDSIGDESTSENDMRTVSQRISVYLSQSNWIACQTLVEGMFEKGFINVTVPGDIGCRYQWQSEQWLADPCCNHELQFSQCCAPHDVTVPIDTFTSINNQSVSERCADPLKANVVLQQYLKTSIDTSKCDQQIKGNGFDFSTFQTLIGFQQTCQDEIFGTQGVPPSCRVDADCWTQCDQSAQQCIIPYMNPTDALVNCYSQNMDERLQRYLKKQFGLTGANSLQDFIDAFHQNLDVLTCLGPMAWRAQEHWTQENVTSCGHNDRNCYCYFDSNQEQVCMRNVLVPANMTQCLSYQQCNWNWQATEQECASNPSNPSTEFCGDCQGTSCWETTSPSMCRIWTNDQNKCNQMNGTMNSRNPWECMLLNITAQEDCVPSALCPSSNSNSGNEIYCDSFCHNPSITNQTACFASGGFWDGNVRNGICKRYEFGQNGLNCSGSFTLHQGRSWRIGTFDTQETCVVGRCSINPSLNATECASTGACNMPCPACRSQNWGKKLCYFETANSTLCSSKTGKFHSNISICSLDNVLDVNTCDNLNGTFQTCETLDKETCSLCQTSSVGCPVVQSLLQCYVNAWDSCSNQSACQSSGICDDWEFQNYQDSQCRQTQHNPDCNGACLVAPMNATFSGQCPQNSQYSKIGCIDYSIVGEIACQSTGDQWVKRANSESECLAHGYGCYEKRFGRMTNKSQELCESCGGKYVPFYRWTAGRWVTGEMKPLTWTSRQYGPINSWNTTINFTKLHDIVNTVMMQVMAKSVGSQFMCQYLSLTSVMKPIACDCSTQGGSECYSEEFTTAPIGVLDAFSGLDNSGSWANVGIDVPANTLSNDTDSGTFHVSIVSEAAVVSGTSKKRSASNPYSVVYLNGSLVGQVVGSGSSISINQNLSNPITLCLDINDQITILSQNTIPDLGELINGTLQALDISVQIVNSAICGNISETGTYYPVYRSTSAIESTTTTTSESTTSGTTTGESTTTGQPVPEDSLSGSSAGLYIAVSILSAVFLLVIVIMILPGVPTALFTEYTELEEDSDNERVTPSSNRNNLRRR